MEALDAHELATTTGESLAASNAGEAHESAVHVELAAERLGTFIGVPITNTLVTSFIVSLILIVFAVVFGSRIKMLPSRFQTAFELLFTTVADFVEQTLESKMWTRRLLPILLTLFLFIAFANITEFTPGIGSIEYHTASGESVHLLRSVNTDLNVTLALTVIVVLLIEIAGIMALGFWRYAGKFFNFSSPINFVVGIIEFVSEMSRFVSFSFRLFGNVFAGEVLIAVVGYFMPYILPVPLMAFEMFVGIVQGAVFALLTLFFVKLAIAAPHGEEAHAH